MMNLYETDSLGAAILHSRKYPKYLLFGIQSHYRGFKNVFFSNENLENL